jgi:hypothetical protein
MPQFSVTRPDDIQHEWITANSPITLSLPRRTPQARGGAIVDGRFVFVDPADQDLGAGT